MTREHLLETVWEDSYDKKLKTVNVAIKRLKAKIDPDGTKDYIKSIRGEGYLFAKITSTFFTNFSLIFLLMLLVLSITIYFGQNIYI